MDALDHMAIQVQDVQRAVDWYRARFDVRIGYQDDTWALLEFANIRLALVIPQQHPAHLAVWRDDAERFGPLKTHRDGTASIYIKDSEGNCVEIMQQPAG